MRHYRRNGSFVLSFMYLLALGLFLADGHFVLIKILLAFYTFTVRSYLLAGYAGLHVIKVCIYLVYI